jgi:hypothetical protein
LAVSSSNTFTLVGCPLRPIQHTELDLQTPGSRGTLSPACSPRMVYSASIQVDTTYGTPYHSARDLKSYQVLRPSTNSVKKHAPDPGKWLEQNSNDRYALPTKPKILPSLRELGRVSSKPRAALISLVRNSELDGLVQVCAN